MKQFTTLALLSVVFFTSCQKKIEPSANSINGEAIASENGVWVEPCHSTAFSTNYTTLPGKVPPFRFTKTHYTSGRVKTINMLSRANPNHSAFKQQAWEVIGTFTYNGVNEAYLVGTKQLWEYYKTSTGGAARKSIIKKNIKLTFRFHYDYTGSDYAQAIGACKEVINNLEGGAKALNMGRRIGCCGYPLYINVGPGSDEPENRFQAIQNLTAANTSIISSMDDFENIEGPAEPGFEFVPPSDYRLRKRIKFTTTSNPNAKNFSYQPTQNWISLEYTIVEAMNWTAFKTAQRATVSVEFYSSNNSASRVVQSQKYLNHRYDTKGNLLSYTYGDNVLQKTTWLCKAGTPPPEY